jgi:hypothetical protein
MLVAVKQKATGSILDKPKGNLLVQLVNSLNLFFLLVVNPVAAILLITQLLARLDPTRITIHVPWILTVVEVAGLVMYLTGFLLMTWVGIDLAGTKLPTGRQYASARRSDDYEWTL